jgi:hypothetical protein
MKGLRASVFDGSASTGRAVTTFAFPGVNMFLSGRNSDGEP